MFTSTHKTSCPSCGELIELVIDPGDAEQTYIEDCQVCCRPMHVSVHDAGDGGMEVHTATENES